MVPPRVFSPSNTAKKSLHILKRMAVNCAHNYPALFFFMADKEFCLERRKLHEMKCYCCMTVNSGVITVSKACESKYLQ